jgi:hypothetical protein
MMAHFAKKLLAVFHIFERKGRSGHLALTERFYRACRKGNIWQSPAFLRAVKNSAS